MKTESLHLTRQQEKLLLVPESISVANFGGRGGGKTRGAIYAAVRHIQQHGALARVWIIRQTFPGLQDLERECRLIFPQLFPGCAYNGQKHEWRFANGAVLELGVLDSEASFARWQGRTATLVIVDEIQQFGDPRLIDLLRSCLRGPEGLPTRMLLCANPSGVVSYWIFQRFFGDGKKEGEPFVDDFGTTWVRLSSTLEDNQFIDQERYLAELKAATAGDRDLELAWVEGRFDILRG